MKAQNKINDEEYRKQLQRIYAEQENNEKLISDMAERFSTIDYDQIDEFYRQVAHFIENGELARADSLLRTKGDLNAQVAQTLKQGAAIREAKKDLNKVEAVQAATIKEQAQRCYSYHETFLMRHENDYAAHYIKLRAALDATKVEWQCQAGAFIREYLANYALAMEYY